MDAELSLKNILYIHHGSLKAGAAMSLMHTIRAAQAHNYATDVGLVRPSPELERLYIANGCRVFNMSYIPLFITYSASEGKRWNPVTWWYIYDAIRRWKKAIQTLTEFLAINKYSLVHLNSVALSNPAEACQSLNQAFVWHVREHGPNTKGKRYMFLRRRLNSAKHVIFLSLKEQTSWLGSTEHGCIIPNFIESKYLATDDVNRFQVGRTGTRYRDTITLLYVGGLKKHKGIDVLLQALVQAQVVLEGSIALECLMPDCSESDQMETRFGQVMQRQMSTAKLDGICKLLPFIPNIVDLYKRADILIFPATVPHFSRPVLEASHFGVPSIASDLDPLPDMIDHGASGILVTPGNANELAEAIVKLSNNADLRKTMGDKARSLYLSKYRSEMLISKLMKLYHDILNTDN